ncbi:lysine exporter protein LysE/YggA [Paenibacillus mucilaginosus 3016]|uniref:Lysine exporter protein LysE/YggA n=1 Tax=Paenibacillus mucilaginosus 3016 TaxID=1116391 RepID=H6NFE6_9BACL|nr:LysE family transporter [Paenibacillus mucilaginosus]AFC29555.1 lysine exporter protein LysE/YggA [Paenibacillus mucilaginosus 3016]WFA18247.1 LysE family translocator [Paenibacillus mucilaginosus]
MEITSFLIYCLIATFTPGPTNIVILSTVHRFGAKQAMEYTYGATLGFGLLLVISAGLNTMLLTVIPKLILVMQVIGSCYMFYLAYQLYRTDTSKPAVTQTATFISGFLMQFFNPKVVLFTITVIPTFVIPYDSAISALSISILAITVIGFLAFTTWVLFGTIFKDFLQKHTKTVNVMMALFLAYAAVMVWM